MEMEVTLYCLLLAHDFLERAGVIGAHGRCQHYRLTDATVISNIHMTTAESLCSPKSGIWSTGFTCYETYLIESEQLRYNIGKSGQFRTLFRQNVARWSDVCLVDGFEQISVRKSRAFLFNVSTVCRARDIKWDKLSWMDHRTETSFAQYTNTYGVERNRTQE